MTQPTNRFAGTLLGRLPPLLPANFLQGIDVQTRDFERGTYDPGWQSYLFGQWQQGGWWYYYIVGLFAKVPLAIWCLLGLGTVLGVRAKVAGHSVSGLGMLSLWVPALAFLVVVSSATSLNRYVRYALPVLPVILIWASQVGRLFEEERTGESTVTSRLLRTVVVGCGLWLVASTMSNSPHHLSYFNSAAGGSESGYRWLCDSNVDWGQDLIALQEWVNEHPEVDGSLYLAYFGSFDPASVGVRYQMPPVARQDSRHGAAPPTAPTTPGWYVISKNFLAGHSMPVPAGSGAIEFQYVGSDAFAGYRELTPVDEIGRSMWVFHIPEISTTISSTSQLASTK